MKKTIIASKELANLGLQQVVATLDTNELTIERKIYYNGKINKKETTYFVNDHILDVSWDNEIQYNKDNEYTMIYL